MSDLLFLQKIHGHLGLLALALCLHPWFALRRARRPKRAVRISCYLATVAVIAANVMGWLVYPAYREDIKPLLYAANAVWGDLFEVKEHLAWYSMCLAAAGSVVTWLARDKRGDAFRNPIRILYTTAGALVAGVAGIGIYLASIRGFDYPL